MREVFGEMSMMSTCIVSCCEHNLWNSIVIVCCDLCLSIVLILSPDLNCFQRLLKFRIFIARVLSAMRPYQALTNNSPYKGQLHDIKTFTFSRPLPKKVDLSLSPPSPQDSSCRVSSPLICCQQSSGHLHVNSASVFVSVCA